MREIKFRAWDKVRNEFLSAGEVLIAVKAGRNPKHNPQYLDVLESPDLFRDRFVLMQFTGLKDKNGKEIYEGDILGDGIVVEVQFHDGKFVGVQSNKKYSLGDCCGNYGRILGNIYENPELVK